VPLRNYSLTQSHYCLSVCVQGGDNAEHGGESHHAWSVQETHPSVTHTAWQGLCDQRCLKFTLAPYELYTRNCTVVHITNENLTRWFVVEWLSGRTFVFDRRTFPVLRSTCSSWVTTYVCKPSAVGQPTRPTRHFIFSGLINE